MTGAGYIAHGTASTGPFETRLTVSQSGASFAGAILLGGRLSGRDVTRSLIGDSGADLVFGGENNTSFVTISTVRCLEQDGACRCRYRCGTRTASSGLD